MHSCEARKEGIDCYGHRAKSAGTPVPVTALMLHSDPQLVHFREVDQKKVDCI